jgi:hypothetical protein
LTPFIENSGGDGSFADGLAKNKFCTDIFGLLSPKTTLKSLLGPYECKLQ